MYEIECDSLKRNYNNIKDELSNFQALFENLDADTFLGQIIGRVFKKVSDLKKK